MNVCIAGGGKVGLYLAQSLQSHRHKITIMSRTRSSAACWPTRWTAL